jgi:hypothetical protein
VLSASGARRLFLAPGCRQRANASGSERSPPAAIMPVARSREGCAG